MTYQCEIIPFGSELYEQTVLLRTEVLRKPLNLVFTEEQLAAEVGQVHFACFTNDSEGDRELVGCLILVPDEVNSMVQMRQVAVAFDKQQQGIGQQLVRFAEDWAIDAGYQTIFCHARDVAVPFYLKLGYHIVGEGFTEVSILHYYMEKHLSPA
jgi:predicted N-acetyltransferase YhbS